MIIIPPSIVPNYQKDFSLKGCIDFVGDIARICYQSSNPSSKNEQLVYGVLIHNGHLSVLEHATVYFYNSDLPSFLVYLENKDRRYRPEDSVGSITRTNLRSVAEYLSKSLDYSHDMKGGMEYFRKYMIEEPDPTLMKALPPRITFIANTRLDIEMELNRHRQLSITAMSTRFCDFTNGNKFEEGLRVGKVDGFRSDLVPDQVLLKFTKDGLDSLDGDETWMMANIFAEACYARLRSLGYPTDKTRTILPYDTAVQIAYTASREWWEDLLNQRYHGHTGKPHEDARILCGMIHEELQKLA